LIRLFRAVAFFEGLTTLALFLVAMPVKYWLGNPVLVPPIGMLHGVAFLVYIAVMLITLPTRGFSLIGWLRTTLAAFVPFGTFLNDSYLKARQQAFEARKLT
jgi:integral membrane protein